MSGQMFLDMNSYFASVEQQDNPALRGKPVVVAPIVVETTCALAASYEAKATGIKTGTSIKECRRLCPEVIVVQARPQRYIDMHKKILAAMGVFFSDIHVLSVDELTCTLGPEYQTRNRQIDLGRELKAEVYRTVGETMRCSIGFAPNVFLAKVAAETMKPDGLVVWDQGQLGEQLEKLCLRAMPGIGARMEDRLNNHGIYTMEELLAADAQELRRAWGSVVGTRWWFMLRGSKECDYGMNDREFRASVSHSHILPPDFRTDEGAHTIMIRLASKALRRLRDYNQAASSVQVAIVYRNPKTFEKRVWKRESKRHLPTNTEATWMPILRKLGIGEGLTLTGKPSAETVQHEVRISAFTEQPSGAAQRAARHGRFAGWEPMQAAIAFGGLTQCEDLTLSLFDDTLEKAKLWGIVDDLNKKKAHSVDLASVFWLRDQAPKRIPFGNTMLN